MNKPDRELLLVVAGQDVLREHIARGLFDLSVEIALADSVETALVLLKQRLPRVVIADVDLPDGSGLEIVSAIEGLGRAVSTILISPHRLEELADFPARADVQILVAPASIEEIHDLVQKKLERRTSPPAPFSALEYIQVASMGRRSLNISFESGRTGRIVLVDGDVIFAEDALGAGPPAFVRMLRLRGPVRCMALRGAAPPRNLEAGVWRHWAIEVLAPSDPEPPIRFEDAWDQGVGAVLSGDLALAFERFREAQALRPEDPRPSLNLQRLGELGYGAKIQR